MGTHTDPGTGRTGQYKMYAPSKSEIDAGKPFGLLLYFHGDFSAAYYEAYADMLAKAAGDHQLIIVSLAVPEAQPETSCWWAPAQGDNARYVEHFIQSTLFKGYNINPNRIFLTGESGGAYFASALPAHLGFKYRGGVIAICGGIDPRQNGGSCSEDREGPALAVPKSIPEVAKRDLRFFYAINPGDFVKVFADSSAFHYRRLGFEVSYNVVAGSGHCNFGTLYGVDYILMGLNALDPAFTTPAPSPVPHVFPNAKSTLGTNLGEVIDYSPEFAFVDAFKMSRPWISGRKGGSFDDGRPVSTDEDGWVTALLPDQEIHTLVLTPPASLSPDAYPSGLYTVLYEGDGDLSYRGAAILQPELSAPGMDVIDCNPTRGAIQLTITRTNPANPLRAIRVVMPGGVCANDATKPCELEVSGEAQCGAGAFCRPFTHVYEQQLFHPLFLERIRKYKALRYMDWMKTNDSTQESPANRPKMSDARWSVKGVPFEVLAELANRVEASPWFTLPHLATDDYVRELARLASRQVDPRLKIYLEHSNEVWNGIFAQARYARDRGRALGLGTTDFEAQIRYHSKRSLEIFGLWTQGLGGTSRLVRVMGSWAAVPFMTEQILGYANAYQNTDAVAIAPYFGNDLGNTAEFPESTVQGYSLAQAFEKLTQIFLPRAVEKLGEHLAAIAAVNSKIELVAYEGGQHLVGVNGVENNANVNALFDAVNRAPEMKAVYADYLNRWKAGGGKLFVHFNNCGGYTKFGRWGALESLLRPTSPKYEALMQYIDEN